MRRRQIYAQQLAEAQASALVIPKEIEKYPNQIDLKTGKVICGICKNAFDKRGFNTHRRICK